MKWFAFAAWLREWPGELRRAARGLARSPGLAAVAVFSLALGIGANTAVFSLLNAVQLRSLPVPNPRELRVLNWSGPLPKEYAIAGAENFMPFGGKSVSGQFSYPAYRTLREHGAGYAELFAFAPSEALTAAGPHDAFPSQALLVSGNFFAGYGTRPLLGRPLTPEDDRPGAAPAAVITYRCWERHFGLDPEVIRKSVRLNRTTFDIVGVLPQEHAGPLAGDAADFYLPLAAQPAVLQEYSLASPDHYWLQLMLRLPPGATEAAARTSLEAIFRQHQAPLAEAGAEPPTLLLKDGRHGPWMQRLFLADPLRVLGWVVGLVLAIACANVAGLLVARQAARERELAVRLALGAGRGRLMSQALAESLVLAGAGACLGLLFACWGKTALAARLPGLSQGVHFDAPLDGAVLAFTLGVTVLTALLAGGLSAWHAVRTRPARALQSARALGAPRQRLSRALVVGQVAVCLVLLAGTGLFVRTLANLRQIPLGFDAENLLVFKLNAAQAGHEEPELPEFYRRVAEAVGAIPGVRQVAFADQTQLGEGYGVHKVTVPEAAAPVWANYMRVSETYFATTGIPLLAGRAFNTEDTAAAPRSAIVNAAFAKAAFGDASPLGRKFTVNGRDYEVVGLCGDARYRDAQMDLPRMTYLPYRQAPAAEVWFQARSPLPPAALGPAVRRAVAGLDRNVPVADLTTQIELTERQSAEQRLFASLGGVLAGFAVLLACLGLYGLLAFNVARRTSEIGLRMALGATPRHVAWPMVREALWIGGLGVGVGALGAFAGLRMVKWLLYGVHPYDPGSLLVAAGLLLLVALVAAWLPARRAMRVDPMTALRCE